MSFKTTTASAVAKHRPLASGRWVLGALLFAALTHSATAEVVGHVRGRLLVKFNEGTPELHKRAEVAAVGGQIQGEIPKSGVQVVGLPINANLSAAINALKNRPNVEFAEPDMLVRADQITPNDPYYATTWHLSKINCPSAWTSSSGSSSVVIAILDSGCESTHPDLSSKLVPGWNFVNNNNNTADVTGHGTAVAGVAAAASNNNSGVASVAWGCKIMPLRIADSTGTASYSTMASAITYAADHGVRVVNMSYDGRSSSAVSSAAQYLQGKGGIFFISAGNSNVMHSNSENPYEVQVSATDSNDQKAAFSDYGNDVDISAPGVTIKTTLQGGLYGNGSGTSFAAPVVAGVAALVISINPSLTPKQVETILKDSADDLGQAGWDMYFGQGRVNAARAVDLALTGGSTVDTSSPTLSFLSPSAGMTVSGTISVQASASDNVGVSSVTFSLDGVLLSTDTSAPYSWSWNTLNATNGAHNLSVKAVDAMGNQTSQSMTIYVNNVADTTAPTVSITSPTGGSVSASLSISATATDNKGVTKVEFYVDGSLKGSDSSAPYSVSINTKKWTRGTHALQCKAYDAAGNSAWSQTVSVTK